MVEKPGGKIMIKVRMALSGNLWVNFNFQTNETWGENIGKYIGKVFLNLGSYCRITSSN